ncbi:hypothetical protein LLH23_10320 [bacterium]|nr:hypothetical protein [bacterium]
MALEQQQTPASHIIPPAGTVAGVTVRAVVLAIIFTLIASYWIDMAEVVTFFCQITEAVPAVPAVAFLIALVVITPLVRRLSKRWALKRVEILSIYVFLTVATSMAGPGIARFFINTIPVLFYFDTPENDFASYQRYMPDWMVPHDRETIRQLYEGAPEPEGGANFLTRQFGLIPWHAWAKPIAMWGLLFVALWILLMCMTVVFRRQWSEKEKLIYPLLYLPMEVTDDIDGSSLVGAFFRNRIMWIGFGIAFLCNVGNIANAYNPQILALGKYYDIGRLFTERPLSALRPMQIHYRPEMIGFGYLMSTEVAMSVWVFYLVLKLESLVTAVMGVQLAGFPYAQEQSMGAYVAMAFTLLFVARHHLWDVVRKAFSSAPDVDDTGEPMSYRTAVIGGLIALAVTVGWMLLAGMSLWLTVVYLGLILMTALVYTRIRAEIGVPLVWMFPYYQQYRVIKYFTNSRVLMDGGQWRSATIFTTLVFLSRGYFPSLMGYQAEGFRLSHEAGMKSRPMAWNLLLALIVGLFVAIWLHLRSYYAYGAGGVGALEGWGAGISKAEYTALTGYAKAATPADVPRIIATLAGFVVAAGLMGARMVFLKFPLHPLAFCMTTSYGELIWGTFFLVWLIKTLVFRLGGMKAYRQLIPGFIGLALGHYFTAGIVYSLIGSSGSAPDWVRRYGVWFG